VVRQAITDGRGGAVHLVEPQAGNRKVMKPWFDYRCGSASLCPWRWVRSYPVLP